MTSFFNIGIFCLYFLIHFFKLTSKWFFFFNVVFLLLNSRDLVQWRKLLKSWVLGLFLLVIHKIWWFKFFIIFINKIIFYRIIAILFISWRLILILLINYCCIINYCSKIIYTSLFFAGYFLFIIFKFLNIFNFFIFFCLNNYIIKILFLINSILLLYMIDIVWMNKNLRLNGAIFIICIFFLIWLQFFWYFLNKLFLIFFFYFFKLL